MVVTDSTNGANSPTVNARSKVEEFQDPDAAGYNYFIREHCLWSPAVGPNFVITTEVSFLVFRLSS